MHNILFSVCTCENVHLYLPVLAERSHDNSRILGKDMASFFSYNGLTWEIFKKIILSFIETLLEFHQGQYFCKDFTD